MMAAIVDEPDSPYQTRLALSFALGKAFLDMGDCERAFARLRKVAALGDLFMGS
jgi:hypothetical protein